LSKGFQKHYSYSADRTKAPKARLHFRSFGAAKKPRPFKAETHLSGNRD
jgi:hypothetical protein